MTGPPGGGGGTADKEQSRWSVRLGTVAGVEIRLHASFLILLVLFLPAGNGYSWSYAGQEFLWVITVFVCVVVHEVCHCIVARRFGVGVRDILLLPIGGLSEMEEMPEEPARELAIAGAGPGASLALGLAAAAGAAALGNRIWPPTLLAGAPLARLAWLNLLLAGFNLLPALPLDGGRMLRAGLSLRGDRGRATEVAVTLGKLAGLILALSGLFYDVWLIFIGGFVYMAASAEGREEQLRQGLSRLTVKEVMMISPWVMDANEIVSPITAGEACRRQGVLPVVSEGVYAGAIVPGRADWSGPGRPAGEQADRGVPVVHPDDRLDRAFLVLRQSRLAAVPVTGPDRSVVGILRGADVVEAFNRAGGGRASVGAAPGRRLSWTSSGPDP